MGGKFAPKSVKTTIFHLRQTWRKGQDIIKKCGGDGSKKVFLPSCQPTKVDFRIPRPNIWRCSSCGSARCSKRVLAIRANS